MNSPVGETRAISTRLCEDFVGVVEALLAQRRAGPSRSERFPAPCWTRDELCDLAYASYKALVRGQVIHPPRRATVKAVADYLDCTLAERNRLLTAAGLAPEQPELQGPHLTAVLTLAQGLLGQLAFPGVLVTRDWSIHGWNAPMQRLMRLSTEAITAWPADQRTILHLLFDPASPLYALLGGGDHRWEQLARRDLLSFKRHNHLSRHETWYAQRLQSLMHLPRFAELWQDVEVDAAAAGEAEQHPHEVALLSENGTPILLNALWISFTDLDYPRVLAFAPQGGAAAPL